jgi:hypothetical protein
MSGMIAEDGENTTQRLATQEDQLKSNPFWLRRAVIPTVGNPTAETTMRE